MIISRLKAYDFESIKRKKRLKMLQWMILVKQDKLIKQPYRLFVANEKFNSLTMNFRKNQCWLKVRRANLDQQYACLKKVLLHSTSAVVFVDNVSSSSGRRGTKEGASLL